MLTPGFYFAVTMFQEDVMKRSTEFLKSLDVKLILILLALCVTSIAAIYSSQQTGQYGEANFAMKQGLNYIIGVVLLLLVASIDLDQLQKLSWPLYIVDLLHLFF